MSMNFETLGFKLTPTEVKAIAEKLDRTQKIVILLLLFTLALSIVLTSLNLPQHREVLVYFSDLQGQETLPEKQFIPYGATVEEGIRLLIDEVLLGPIDLLKLPIFPEHAKLLSVFVSSGNNLVLNFSQDLLAAAPSHAQLVGYKEAFALLDKTIRANFPFLSNVDFLISGQVFGSAPYWH